MSNMIQKIILLLLVVGWTVSADESVNNYIKATLENLKLRMPHGISELNLPPTDPLTIPNLNININEGSAKVNLKVLYIFCSTYLYNVL
jgi:hypothetical protein